MLFGGRGAPTRRELVHFGLSLVALFAAIGALVLWRTGSWTAALTLWLVALAVGGVYFLVPSLRRPLYSAWMTLTAPIAWAVSYLVLGIVYYLVLTPVGLLLRLAKRDPLDRAADAHAATYWVEREAAEDPGRYFRQF